MRIFHFAPGEQRVIFANLPERQHKYKRPIKTNDEPELQYQNETFPSYF